MKRLIILILLFYLSSCNPRMYIIGGGMRHHNLSQNKYQPKKHRKPVRLGSSPNSPFWIIKRRF
jgi:hypothetical protein